MQSFSSKLYRSRCRYSVRDSWPTCISLYRSLRCSKGAIWFVFFPFIPVTALHVVQIRSRVGKDYVQFVISREDATLAGEQTNE